MRKYQPVWEQIKINKICELSAHRLHHPRIIKAVKKEKDMDILYKLENLELSIPLIAIMRSSRKGSIIKFTLTLSPLISIDTI